MRPGGELVVVGMAARFSRRLRMEIQRSPPVVHQERTECFHGPLGHDGRDHVPFVDAFATNDNPRLGVMAKEVVLPRGCPSEKNLLRTEVVGVGCLYSMRRIMAEKAFRACVQQGRVQRNFRHAFPQARSEDAAMGHLAPNMRNHLEVSCAQGRVAGHLRGAGPTQAVARGTLTRDTSTRSCSRKPRVKDAVGSGAIKVQGNEGKLEELMSYLNNFDFWRVIITP